MLPSPCIKVCKMDPDSGLCQGCFRTLEEIAAWSRCSEAEQAAILAAVARRRRKPDSRDGTFPCNGDDGAP